MALRSESPFAAIFRFTKLLIFPPDTVWRGLRSIKSWSQQQQQRSSQRSTPGAMPMARKCKIPHLLSFHSKSMRLTWGTGTALIRPERSMLWCRKVLKPPKQDQIAMTTLLKMSLRKLPDPRARIAISMLVLSESFLMQLLAGTMLTGTQ